jgi:branched-chain amino acid transport system substrate-binding protein
VVSLIASAAQAQTANTEIKIGLLVDMSGVYADTGGTGSVTAAKLAVEDFNPSAHGLKVTVVSADHHNNPTLGASIASQWFDTDGVDAIVDVPNSDVALAVSQIARDKNKVFLASSAATSDLTGPQCSPNTIQWTFDTWMLAHVLGTQIVKTGGDSWYFLTADYSFGKTLEHDTGAVVTANGGKVLGTALHPLNTRDFSSFLQKAQASKASIIGLADAGLDAERAVRQGAELGITAGHQKFAGLLFYITDVNALGLKIAQGLVLTETWYWDMTEANRAFTKRWRVEQPGKFPNMAQAGVYSAVTHYLKAVVALKSGSDGAAVIAKMKEMPTDDPLFGKGIIRADGRKIHPAYLFEVKKPSESKYPGDVFKLRATIPGDEAFRPMKDDNCPLLKN